MPVDSRSKRHHTLFLIFCPSSCRTQQQSMDSLKTTYGPISTPEKPSCELTAVLKFRFFFFPNISPFKKWAKVPFQNSIVGLSNCINKAKTFLPIFIYFWQSRHQTVASSDRSLLWKWLKLVASDSFHRDIKFFFLLYFAESNSRLYG